MTTTRLRNAYFLAPRWLRNNPQHSVPMTLLALYFGVWLLVPRYKPHIVPAPLPLPAAITPPAAAPETAAAQETIEPPAKYHLVQTLRLRDKKDAWRLEKWETDNEAWQASYLKFFCEGRFICKVDADELEGKDFGLGELLFAGERPVVVMEGITANGNGARKRFYTLWRGKAILMLETPYCTGGPIFRDYDGDGKPEWVFDDYDWYTYYMKGPEYLEVYKQGPSGVLELWKELPNSHRRHVSDTIHWLHDKKRP